MHARHSRPAPVPLVLCRCTACGLYWKKTGQLRDIALLENKGRGAKVRAVVGGSARRWRGEQRPRAVGGCSSSAGPHSHLHPSVLVGCRHPSAHPLLACVCPLLQRRREYLAGLPRAPEMLPPDVTLPADQAQALVALAAAAAATGEAASSGPARAAPAALHPPAPRHTSSGGGSPHSSSPREALAPLLSLSPPPQPLSPQREPALGPASVAAPGYSPAGRPRPGPPALEEQYALLELLLAAEASGSSPSPAKRPRPGGVVAGQQGAAGAALPPMGPLTWQLPTAGHGATTHLLDNTLTGTPPAKLAALLHLISEEERQQHVQVVMAWLGQHGQQAQRSQQLPHAQRHSLGGRHSAFHPYVPGRQQAPALASPRSTAGSSFGAPPPLPTQQGWQAELAAALHTLGVQLAPAQQEALGAGLRRLGPPAAGLLPAAQQLVDSVSGAPRPHQPGNGLSAGRQSKQPAAYHLWAQPPVRPAASSSPTSPGPASPPAGALSPAAGGAAMHAVHAGRPLTALPPGVSLALASSPTWRSGAPTAPAAAALQQPHSLPLSPSAALAAALVQHPLLPPPPPLAALCTDAVGLLAALQMCSAALPGLQQAQH